MRSQPLSRANCGARCGGRPGLRRRGYSAAVLVAIKRAYKTLYHSGLRLDEALMQIERLAPACAELEQFVEFIRTTRRGIVR